MQKQTCVLLTAALALSAGHALAQSKKVLPAAAATAEGSSASAYPFGYTNPRMQQIWSGSALSSATALLSGISYRLDGRSGANNSRSYTNVTFAVGGTTMSPTTMTTNFATNVTHTLTTVVSGNYNLPAQAPTATPRPFNISFGWSVPYVLDCTKYNLLFDVTLPGPVGKSNYIVDGEVYSGTGGGGNVSSFGSTGAFSSLELVQLGANANSLVPGGSLDVTCGKFNNSYIGYLIFGTSDKSWTGVPLPLDLALIGAPKNKLYVSMDLLVPFSTNNQNVSSFTANIPNNPAYAGQRFFAQAYYQDQNANNAGLVATHGLNLLTGGGNTGPITQVVGHYDSTMANGNFYNGANRYGGPVAEFNGIFP